MVTQHLGLPASRVFSRRVYGGGHKMNDKPGEKNAEGAIFIGAGVEFNGDMTVPGIASVDGKFTGTLKAKALIVGQSGHVSGQISVETAEVRGTVGDHLVVQSKLTLRSSGSISGSISYSKIMVEEGGELAGTIEMIPQPKGAAASEPNVVMLQRSGE
jgi:cytoskeletal protein CcmA (bactofilin family)